MTNQVARLVGAGIRRGGDFMLQQQDAGPPAPGRDRPACRKPGLRRRSPRWCWRFGIDGDQRSAGSARPGRNDVVDADAGITRKRGQRLRRTRRVRRSLAMLTRPPRRCGWAWFSPCAGRGEESAAHDGLAALRQMPRRHQIHVDFADRGSAWHQQACASATAICEDASTSRRQREFSDCGDALYVDARDAMLSRLATALLADLNANRASLAQGGSDRHN